VREGVADGGVGWREGAAPVNVLLCRRGEPECEWQQGSKARHAGPLLLGPNLPAHTPPNPPRLEEINESRQGMVHRVRVAEKEKDALEVEKLAAEAFLAKERECLVTQGTLAQVFVRDAKVRGAWSGGWFEGGGGSGASKRGHLPRAPNAWGMGLTQCDDALCPCPGGPRWGVTRAQALKGLCAHIHIHVHVDGRLCVRMCVCARLQRNVEKIEANMAALAQKLDYEKAKFAEYSAVLQEHEKAHGVAAKEHAAIARALERATEEFKEFERKDIKFRCVAGGAQGGRGGEGEG
jgi:hypothetical protein